MAGTTKRNEIHQAADAELLAQLDDLRKELFNVRFQIANGSLDNTSRQAEVKRQIARVLTELREREIAAAEALDKETD